MENSVGQYQTQPVQPQAQAYAPQPAPIIPGSQSGVHIQIFNPSVGMPGGAPVYNVNAPSYGTNPNQTPSYPSNYYTNNWGQGCCVPQYPCSNVPGQSINGGVTQTQNVTVNPIPEYNASNMPAQNGINTQQSQIPQNGQASATAAASTDAGKKTEKRTIVMLTDDYIKNVENYLNSQDKEVRLMGAKEVVARALEDPSRKDDKALTALVNKSF